MLRRLFRMLVFIALLVVAGWAISRFLNREEDFDDFEDIDATLDFTETPVEIDVPYEAGGAALARSESSALAAESASEPAAQTAESPAAQAQTGAAQQPAAANRAPAAQGSLIDIDGIGPTYASRLRDIGITSLDDLAGADAGAIAGKMEVIGGREKVQDWIKQAQEMAAGSAASGSQSGE